MPTIAAAAMSATTITMSMTRPWASVMILGGGALGVGAPLDAVWSEESSSFLRSEVISVAYLQKKRSKTDEVRSATPARAIESFTIVPATSGTSVDPIAFGHSTPVERCE